VKSTYQKDRRIILQLLQANYIARAVCALQLPTRLVATLAVAVSHSAYANNLPTIPLGTLKRPRCRRVLHPRFLTDSRRMHI